MTVIGLTGGIASGKSTAADQLRLLGALIIDADRIGHRSYEPGTPGFEKVVNAFGHDIVGKDGTIDRRVLGGKVFGAPGEMERLNTVLWPEMRRIIQEEIREIKRRDREAVIVLEAAVLIEASWQDLCDEVWVVTTPVKTAVERLASRNGLTEEQAMARINAQMSSRERAEFGNVKIENSGTEEQLRARVDRCWKALQKQITERQPRAAKSAATRTPAAKSAGSQNGRSGGATTASGGGASTSTKSRTAQPKQRPATSRSKASGDPGPAKAAGTRSAQPKAGAAQSRSAAKSTAAKSSKAKPAAAKSTSSRAAKPASKAGASRRG